MTKYRKLTEAEAIRLSEQISTMTNPTKQANADVVSYVKKFYSKNAVSVRFEMNSEYNDETYNNSVTYVAVLDKDGNELQPIAGQERAARAAARYLEVTDMYETNEPVEDFQEWLPGAKFEVPNLYIEE